jgi:hypothetical protein
MESKRYSKFFAVIGIGFTPSTSRTVSSDHHREETTYREERLETGKQASHYALCDLTRQRGLFVGLF